MQNGEHIDYGYTGTTAVPKEVRNMKNTILKLFGISFSGKQLLLSAGAIAVFFLIFKITTALGLTDLGIALSVFAAVPFIVLAFVKKHGLDYEDWLLVKRANTKYSNAVRKNTGLNEYEKLEDLYDRSQKTGRKKKHRKKKSRGSMQAFR